VCAATYILRSTTGRRWFSTSSTTASHQLSCSTSSASSSWWRWSSKSCLDGWFVFRFSHRASFVADGMHPSIDMLLMRLSIGVQPSQSRAHNGKRHAAASPRKCNRRHQELAAATLRRRRRRRRRRRVIVMMGATRHFSKFRTDYRRILCGSLQGGWTKAEKE
jgi:hypothetical protein